MEHEHEHNHEHTTPLNELVVLIRYLVAHNESHTDELKDLAMELDYANCKDEYENVLNAISEYDKGNAYLKKALESLQKKKLGD